MRAPRALAAAVLVAGIGVVVPPTPAVAQDPELPELTAEQRWQRAAMHASLFATLLLREAAETGQTPVETANELVGIFGPGWDGADTPLEMARAIRRNWMIWPNAAWELQETSADAVRFRMNRPWRGVFGEDGVAYGVSEADFNTWLRAFHEGIAARNGLAFTQTEAGDWLQVTIAAR